MATTREVAALARRYDSIASSVGGWIADDFHRKDNPAPLSHVASRILLFCSRHLARKDASRSCVHRLSARHPSTSQSPRFGGKQRNAPAAPYLATARDSEKPVKW